MGEEFRAIRKSLAICRALADIFGAPCCRKPSTAAYRFWRPTAAASCADCWVENLDFRSLQAFRSLARCTAATTHHSPLTTHHELRIGSGKPRRTCCRHEESV